MTDKKPGTPTFDDEERPLTLLNAKEFTPEEIEKYRKEAEHNVAVKLRAEAAKALVEKLEREALSRGDPNEAMTEVVIDVPGFADRVVINGVAFLHNTTHTVTVSQAASIKDIMGRAWRHEMEYKQPNRDSYVRPQYKAFNNGAVTRA